MFPTNKKLLAAVLVAFMAVAIASYGAARPERSGGGGEEGGATLAVDETFDTVRKGARLILSYDGAIQAFIGTVVNTTKRTLRQVRVEVHLSNGVELGPTTPQDLAAGKAMSVRLDAAGQSFTGWTPHAEVGPQTGHGSGGEGSEGSEGSGGEGAGGAGEEGGSALTLDQTFDAVRKGARLIMSYDTAAQAFVGTVENTTNATLQQVRVEVHLSNGVELGPTTPQDLAAGRTMPVRLDAAGQSFTGWTPHAEVGPQTGAQDSESSGGGEGGEGSEGSGGEGSEGSGGEGSEGSGGEGSEGSGGEGSEGSGGAGEEGGSALTLDETFDAVRKGARLILGYDKAAQAFIGTVENTTGATLQQVRVEVHLSNGTELGPTTPQDLAAGEAMPVRLDAAGQSFTGWTPHAEVGPQAGTHGSGG